VIVEPKLAAPERVGSEITLGGFTVTEGLADQRLAVPKELFFVVRAVMNLPTSTDV
jgi:hypothetical protein